MLVCRSSLADALAADRKVLEYACGIVAKLRDEMGPVYHAKLEQHDASWIPTAFVAKLPLDPNNTQVMPPQAPPPGHTPTLDFAGGPGFHGPPLPKQPLTGSPPRPPNYGVLLFPSAAPQDRAPHQLKLCCKSLHHLRRGEGFRDRHPRVGQDLCHRASRASLSHHPQLRATPCELTIGSSRRRCRSLRCHLGNLLSGDLLMDQGACLRPHHVLMAAEWIKPSMSALRICIRLTTICASQIDPSLRNQCRFASFHRPVWLQVCRKGDSVDQDYEAAQA